ncbi:hypothetical protein ACF07S_06655 [Streptomyces sp. NPDC016640]|uniref:hypothetical protein n=1 Tax=Streptomyces sp. NPDC016640 TaxID=3364969 RepID=UPI0036FDD80F
MSDVTRRPGGTPPAEGDIRTAPGTGARDPGVRGSAAVGGGPAEEAGRTAPGGESPLVAAHPGPGGSAPPHPGGSAHTASGRTPEAGSRTSAGHLLPHDDTDQLSAQLRHAVAGFVDAPRDAVREADHVLQELTARFTDAVTERRRALRRSWQPSDTEEGGKAQATDTEQLRLALQDYRELAERLLRV